MKIRYLSLTLLLLILLTGRSYPQDTLSSAQSKPTGIRFSGFVKSSFWHDSRKIVGAREDLFLLFPAAPIADAQGQDINARGSFNFSAIASRITGNISGPDAFGARTSGVIEADFTGASNAGINEFRLRHAFVRLQWEKSQLLLGQYWHPMFGVQAFPDVISLNTGAPFQPFIRNPQIAFTRFMGSYSLQAALLAQRDNVSDGPQGPGSEYLRNAQLPNIHLQLIHHGKDLLWGVAGDYKRLQPRLVTDNTQVTTETLDSWSWMAFARYNRQLLTIRAKAILGQNLTEHLLLGGYAVSTKDPITTRETYTPTNHLFLWSNITYGKRIKPGLFAGYAHNFGTSDTNLGIYYGRGHNIAYLYRIAPSISFISNAVQLSVEAEYTSAAYGVPDNRGRITSGEETSVMRLLLGIFYFF